MSFVNVDFRDVADSSNSSGSNRDSSSERYTSSDSDDFDEKDDIFSLYTFYPPSSWEYLPPNILEQIFDYLNIRERYVCSRVCSAWYFIFKSPRIWRHLYMHQKKFTRLRYSLQYRRYEEVISQTQVQLYLGKVGRHLHRISVLPIEDFYTLSEFIKVLGSFLRFFDVYPVRHLKCFDFTFACEIRSGTESMVFGTGGQLLEELKSLLMSFKGMKRLKINDLLLDSREAPDLLSGFLNNNRESLQYLEVLNVCKVFMPHFYVSTFPNLRILVISPSQISDEIVVMLGKHSSLEEMILVQNKYTCDCEPVNAKAWLQMRRCKPHLRVQLEVRGPIQKEVLIQPGAPVHAILIKTPYTRLEPGNMLQIVDNYKNTLRIMAQLGLPKKHGSRSFNQRCDTYLVMLATNCPKLERLVIRERISTTTLLIIASKARHLKELVVRKNAMIKKFDWPKIPSWSDSFYLWMKRTAKCEELVETEISQILGIKWSMFSDKWFKVLQF